EVAPFEALLPAHHQELKRDQLNLCVLWRLRRFQIDLVLVRFWLCLRAWIHPADGVRNGAGTPADRFMRCAHLVVCNDAGIFPAFIGSLPRQRSKSVDELSPVCLVGLA